MNTALLVLILALLWAGTTGSFSGLNLLFGGLLGLAAAFLLRDSLSSRRGLRRMGRIIRLLALFLYELMASAVRVALVVIRPDLKAVVRPAIVAVPLSVTSDAEITLLANLITLTPGTLSIDVSPDRKHLYVHALTMDDREALIADIVNGFEKQVKAVFE
ncbi:Na+/H+ antiporter subunit E [Devosia sp. 63-57]|uniref:Na+/H+ antiporter subunit E n=1 Tax=Devosia sp. 63-57 TaxID=1895751 RepID=UPI00086CD114|nr:Na+/H+ antiporter subunit E [Devosia sp. 63-57]ODT47422.1 MAG: cation:proton antiporter [Pelagibacterium sp. SCN 63-126]ODU87098.1 MAG: cation:proton antiporter [Pelagibacterium sp. SCN 63-17]OJX42870.1 MAG: Na+/H+ antiporter subunit E [Devosia sp. 63-57]